MLWYGHQWSGGAKWVTGGFFPFSQNVSGLLDVEEETTAANNWVGCNFKPFRDHIFLTLTETDQFCNPPPSPSTKMNNRSFVF